MLYLNVYLVQKCTKHLCCNLVWVPTQFDWTIMVTSSDVDVATLVTSASNLGLTGKTARMSIKKREQ